MEQLSIWHIYLYGVYDNFYGLIEAAAALLWLPLLIVFVARWFYLDDNTDEENPVSESYKKVKPYVVVWIIFIFIHMLTPSKNIVIAMMALEPTKTALTSISDSNRTKSIVNTIDNFIGYIEDKSKDLSNKKD